MKTQTRCAGKLFLNTQTLFIILICSMLPLLSTTISVKKTAVEIAPPPTCSSPVYSYDFSGNSGETFNLDQYGTDVDAMSLGGDGTEIYDRAYYYSSEGSATVVRTTRGTDYSADGDGYFLYVVNADDFCLGFRNFSVANPNSYTITLQVAAWDHDGSNATASSVGLAIDTYDGTNYEVHGSTNLTCTGYNTWYDDNGSTEGCVVDDNSGEPAIFYSGGFGDITNATVGNLSGSNTLIWGTVSITISPKVNYDEIFISKLDGNNTTGLAIDDICIELAATVPVDLVYFEATDTDDNQVRLEWQTASEYQNSYFTVERSQDGVRWDPIYHITGAGTTYTTQDYWVIDEYPLIGKSYYRLKQTDEDGQYEYSDSRTVYISTNRLNDFSIYPNPAKDIISIESEKTLSMDHFQLTNALGEIQSVSRFQVSEQQLQLHVAELPSGIYYLLFNNGKDQNTQKIVVL